jgi:hypothetical protein
MGAAVLVAAPSVLAAVESKKSVSDDFLLNCHMGDCTHRHAKYFTTFLCWTDEHMTHAVLGDDQNNLLIAEAKWVDFQKLSIASQFIMMNKGVHTYQDHPVSIDMGRYDAALVRHTDGPMVTHCCLINLEPREINGHKLHVEFGRFGPEQKPQWFVSTKRGDSLGRLQQSDYRPERVRIIRSSMIAYHNESFVPSEYFAKTIDATRVSKFAAY